jgi:hypothetical protein
MPARFLQTSLTCGRWYFPTWQCFYNPPSEHLALKLGFVDKTETRIPYLHVLESFFKP